MKNLAILMPQRIGDFVLALSVIARKVASNDESITLIVPQHLIPLCTLLSNLPYFPYRRGSRAELLESIAGVKRQDFDVLYLLTQSLSTAWFGLRTGIPVRRGMSGRLVNPFLTEAIVPSREATGDHITKEYASILEVEDAPPEAWPGVTIPPAPDCGTPVVLCPGPGMIPARQWQGFREIIKLLPSYDFVILGDRHDAAVAKYIASHFPHRVRNCAGRTSIETAAAIIAAASVVIADHCGLMHLAGFIGTPVVGIFGSTSELRDRPLGAAVRCATADGSCAPCNKSTCSRRDYICLKSITPEQVIALAGEIVLQPS
ncbi:MAG: glycosyltransferase family 9 protein [Chitinispirillaceae bacterium]|nr:glycosyltransferase family 9 protein [Chitinispirillaceae bacterium]